MEGSPPDAAPRAATSRLARWGAPLLALGLFALYLPTLARGATFSDGPELVTAVVTLGVSHPTGYPLFILIGHAFIKLLPSPLLAVVKIEIMNALCAAFAAALTARTATRLAALIRERTGNTGSPFDADAAGLAAGAMLGIAPLVWEQVRIPEVYPLHLFLVACAGWAWVRFEITKNVRTIVLAALPMGMGLAHHVTMVYMLPAAFLYLLATRASFFVVWLAYPVVRVIRLFKPDFAATRSFAGWWGFPVACLVGFLPLLSYGFLIWANSHTTGIPWGDVHDCEHLYNHFTGKQYQGFLHNLDRAAHLGRIKNLPLVFDAQFLPQGTLLFLVGVVAAFRRAWRPALFFLSFILFNAAHGVHYGVGDYGNYYIPGLYACAVFMGVGLFTLLRFARARRADRRALYTFALLALLLAGAVLSVLLYARFHRLPAPLAAHPYPLAIPLAVLALASITAAVRARRRAAWPRLAIWTGALPAVLLGGLSLSLLPLSVARAFEVASHSVVGESYGAEIAERLPPGAVFMTQGDGFLFTMWYENHVHGRATDAAVLDMGNLRTPWFQRYVRTHHPMACDPKSAQNLLDPQGFAARCDTYQKRMALNAPDSWASMGLVGNRRAFPNASRKPILRGADPRCAEQKWRDEHAGKECRCWAYGKSTGGNEGMLEEDCVESAEEGGVVPREPLEVFAQRIIEDNLAERPVFERNTFTHSSRGKDNPRGWDGPSYQRISGEYALVNRGRLNQIVHWNDVAPHDACADTFQPIAARPYDKPRTNPPGAARRRLYVPNERPTYYYASYLLKAQGGGDDDATRDFAAGDAVYLRLEGFEKFLWDASKPDKRGKPLRHGVRVCVFDPEGKKIAARELLSGGRDTLPLLDRGALGKKGTYHLAACSLGDVGDEPPPFASDPRCKWTFLEYEFTVR
jgi:hypothetical protein